jgi:AcrR family transcriptional regulator
MAAETRANKRQLQAAATREQLLVAARDVFEARGYQATTVGAITARANTAHGTFYLYFKNKEDAFCHVMEDVTNVVYESARSEWGDDPREGIERSLRGFFRTFAEHGGLWRAILEGMLQSPRIEEVWLELRRNFIDGLATVLDAQQDAGRVRRFDPVLGAHAIGAMTEWFAFTHFVLDEPRARDDSHDAIATVVADMWFHAIFGTAGVVDTAAG